MPQPGLHDVHVDRPLTNISSAIIQSAEDFIASKVFPNVPVGKKSDKYFTYTQGYWFRTDAQKRAPATESVGTGYGVSTDDYVCDVYAIHHDIADQIRANADNPLNLDREGTMFVTRQLLLKRELDWVTAFFAASKWTGSTTAGDITPGTKWENVASTPIEDITAQIIAVAKKTGYRPNTFICGPEVWDKLRNHPDIVDRMKTTDDKIVTEALVGRLIGVPRLFVAWAVKNTANEGATASYDFMFGKNALLLYAAPSPGLMVPSAGYTFSWTGYAPGQGPEGNVISTFRMQHLKADRVEGEMTYALKQVAPTLGVYFSACVT